MGDDESVLETLDIVRQPEELAAIRDGLADLEAGETCDLEEVRRAMVARGRLQP
jgi:antitoxin YefM